MTEARSTYIEHNIKDIKEFRGDKSDLVRVMELVEIGMGKEDTLNFKVKYHDSKKMPLGDPNHPDNLEGKEITDSDLIEKKIIGFEPIGLLWYERDNSCENLKYTIYKENEGGK